MGMDVYGRNPSSETGEYFRNNVWWWRPLADYIIQQAPEHLVVQCRHWHSNDGDGLEAEDALELADWLDNEIASGRTAEYAKTYDAVIAAMPRETCDICGGTGIRKDKVGYDMGQPFKVIHTEGHPRKGQKGWCNGCDGIGTKPAWAASYPFSVENVQEFAAFCRDSGGFNIN